MTWSINSPFGGLSSSDSQVGYALLTHSQVAIIQNRNSVHAAPLLACVKPVASVHPEPGSNSPLYNISFTNSRNRITPARSFVIYLILLKTPNSIREINDIFLSTVRILLPRNHISFSGSDRQKRGLRSLVLLSLFYVSFSKNTLFFLSLGSPESSPLRSRKRVQNYNLLRLQTKFFHHFFLTFFNRIQHQPEKHYVTIRKNRTPSAQYLCHSSMQLTGKTICVDIWEL